MLTAKRIRELLRLTRAQFELIVQRAGERAPKPQREGIMRFWREEDLEAFALLVSEAERVGDLRR